MKRFKGFISYSHKDKSFAKKLHQSLEKYKFPKSFELENYNLNSRKLGKFFRDDDELSASGDLASTLKGAIMDSENFILISSPNSAQSKWVNQEVERYFSKKNHRGILSIIIEGKPYSKDSKNECFPPLILKSAIEPLAIVLKEDGYQKSLIRLISGITGVPFDGLWKREKKRKRKNLIISGLSTILLSTFIFWLSAFAMKNAKENKIKTRDIYASEISRKNVSELSDIYKWSNWSSEGLASPIAPDFKLPLSTAIEAHEYFDINSNEAPSIVMKSSRDAFQKTPPWSGILSHNSLPIWAEWSRDGSSILTAEENGIISIWDSNRKIRKFKALWKDKEAAMPKFIEFGWCGENIFSFNGLHDLTDKNSNKRIKLGNFVISSCNCDGSKVLGMNFDKNELRILNYYNGTLQKSTIKFPIGNRPEDIPRITSWSFDDSMIALIYYDRFEIFFVGKSKTQLLQSIEGKFIGWGQTTNKVAYLKKDDNKMSLKQWSYEPIPTENRNDKFWIEPDMSIDDRVFSPNSISPNLKYQIIYQGECNVGMKGGGCTDNQLKIIPCCDFEFTRIDDLEKEYLFKNGVRLLFGHLREPTMVSWHPSGKSFVSIAGYGLTDMYFSVMKPQDDLSAIIWDVSDPIINPSSWDTPGQIKPPFFGEQGLATPFAAKWNKETNKINILYDFADCGACRYAGDGKTIDLSLEDLSWSEPYQSTANLSSYFENIKAPNENSLLWAFKGTNSWRFPDARNEQGLNESWKVWIINNENNDTITLEHPGLVSSARWSPDGKNILTACQDGFARIWNGKSGKLISEFDFSFRSQFGKRLSVDSTDWSPDGNYILIFNYGGLMQIEPANLNVYDKLIKARINHVPPLGITKEDISMEYE